MTQTPEPDDRLEVPPPREAASPAFDRAISPIAGRLPGGRAGKGLVVAALIAGCGVFVAATWGRDNPAPPRLPDEPARQVVPFETVDARTSPTLADPGPDAPMLVPSADGPQVPALEPGAAGAVDSAAQRQAELAAIRGAPILAYSRSGAAEGQAPAVAPDVQAVAADALTELDQLRRASAVGQARATRLPDRNFLIVAGATIPCVLQTAMDTATPGYVGCLIPNDVFSDNGAVVLIERGTRVLGEYRSGMRQGQRRLFVLWTRAVTPAGVAISLGSPATDPLGRAGFDGDIETHFWDRFGGALLLSIVDEGAYAAFGRDAAPGTTRLPSDAAGIALQNSINIPPTLRKPQGSEVSIFVAQDFDFSGVYGLRAR